MYKFADYVDSGYLPGDLKSPSRFKFKQPEATGELFQRFMQLQTDPMSVWSNRGYTPDLFNRFVQMSGGL